MRKRYKPKQKFFGAALVSMRETVYGMAAQVGIHKAMEHCEKLRNDQQLLSEAEEKRLRKMQRNVTNQKGNNHGKM